MSITWRKEWEFLSFFPVSDSPILKWNVIFLAGGGGGINYVLYLLG